MYGKHIYLSDTSLDQFYQLKKFDESLRIFLWLRKIRNSCAHNERVYCIQQTQNKSNTATSGRILDPYYTQLPQSYSKYTSKNIFDTLIYFKYFLPINEYTTMVTELKKMLLDLQNNLTTNAFDNVRGQMGIKALNILDILIQRKPY